MRRITLVTALLAFFLVGCGGGSDTTESDATGATRSGDAYLAKADRVCAAMIADSRRMGDRFRQVPRVGVDALTLTTRHLVKPAIPLLESNARRLRALEPQADSVEYESYVSLFDPIVSLARERALAGEAGESDRAHRLELLSLQLSLLQRSLARDAGLKTCDVDFIQTFSGTGGS